MTAVSGNLEEVLFQSPGLARAAGLPWVNRPKTFSTSKRLRQNPRTMPQALCAAYVHRVFSRMSCVRSCASTNSSGMSVICGTEIDHNLFEVVNMLTLLPRV